MKKILLIIAVFAICISYAQNEDTIDKRVFESSEIVFFGYDFSHFKHAEAGRLNQQDFNKYLPGWYEYLNEYNDEVGLKRKFQKDTVIFNFEYTFSLIDSMADKQFVTLTKHTIPSDSIQDILNSYDIQATNGIGFVVIVECFEKRTETVTAYFVFFDIATKEILMSDYFGTNKAGGMGLKNHWGGGLDKTFNKYISQVYRKRLNSYLKSE